MRKSLFIGLVAALGLIGCSRNQEIDIPDANLSLFAKTESPAESRTVVESGVHVYWEPGDEIAVFMGEKSAKFTTDITAASGTATFKGTFGDATWPEELNLWAVYPFSEDAVFDGETITTVLPSEQIAREGSFGKDMNLSIAHSNSSTLQFYNVGGGIRFSVTEEGVKKVMFEGLSGEIISGKVKIGLDENGKPEVKEVTGGSQFITLLPPDGSETFQKDTWYYIVAIPGSLESGYKLRFYKDSDYARRVSEKAVQIKRSIYGSIEKADEGIEFEPQTTHFPETKEEWEESIQITDLISERVDDIVSYLSDSSIDEIINAEEFVSQALRIEGVRDAFTVGDNVGAVIVQEDGVHLNVLLNHSCDYQQEESNLTSLSKVSFRKSSQQRITTPTLGKKKALLLSPHYNDHEDFRGPISVDVNSIWSSLNAIDYGLSWHYDDNAGINTFMPDTLCKYDLIIVSTHGNYEGFTDQEGNDVGTVLSTGSKIGTIDFDTPQYSKLAAFITKGKNNRYFVSVPWLEGVEEEEGFNPFFDNAIVVMMACNSYRLQDMAHYFTSRSASIYYGNTRTANIDDSNAALKSMVKYLSMGMSVKNAVATMKDNDLSIIGRGLFPCALSDEPNGTAYLINPTPTSLHNTEIRDSKTTLIWEQPKNTGDYRFKVHLKGPNSNSYSTYNSTTSKAYTTDVLQPGEYFWHVEANLYYDGKVIETFISDTKSFTVTEEIHYETPEAIDLGLSVKWASFNLGATKKEDYGYYYAWGETEPYYSSLDPLVWKEGKEAGYDWPSYKWCKGTEDTITKYCFESSYGYNGFTDGKTILDPEDDAAYVNLGGKWRMPTDAEMTELRESCTWKWTSRDGVNGVDVIGPNGNYIFLPAAGCRDWTFLGYVPTYGFYWSSSIRTDSPKAWGVSFDSDHVSRFTGSRQMGNSIRPVYGNPDQRPRISVSPTVINYGDVMVGEWLGNETGRVIFSNTGGADLSISRIWCPEGFSHSPSLTFPIVLSPGDSKTITFAFKPTEVKSYHGYLVIYSNASNDDGRVYVNGNGVE